MKQLRWRTVAAVVLGTGVTLVLVGWAWLRTTFPPQHIAALVCAQVEQATGRSCRIEGGVSIRLLPRLSLVAGDLALGNTSWGSQRDMVRFKRAALEIALRPLLSGRVELRHIEIRGAEVLLETSADDLVNWAMGRPRSPGGAAGSPAGSSARRAITLLIERAQIDDLRIAIVDQRARTRREIAVRSLVLTPGSGGDSVAADAELEVDGQPWRVEGRIGPLAQLLERRSAWPFSVRLSTSGSQVDLDGALPPGEAAQISVQVAAVLRDAPVIAHWTGNSFVPPLPLELRATVRREGGTWWTDDAVVKAPGETARLKAAWEGGAPAKAEIDVEADALDLSRWIGSVKSPGTAAGRPAGGRSALFPDTSWPLDRLPAIDARLEVRIAKLQVEHDLVLEQVVGEGRVAPGRVELPAFAFRLAGGSAKGAAAYAAASGQPAEVQLKFELAGFDVARLLAAAGRADLARGGKGTLTLDLRSSGQSPQQWASAARGTVVLSARGMKLSRSATRVGSDVLSGLLRALEPSRSGPDEATVRCAVVRLPLVAGRAEIERSIAAETDDIDLVALGFIDFGRDRLELAFRPTVKRGIGVSAAQLASLVRFEGPIRQPALSVDAAGTARGIATLGAAVATGGLSLLGEQLLRSASDARPCETALRGGRAAGARTRP